MDYITITPDLTLTPTLVASVARENTQVYLSDDTKSRIALCRASLESVLKDGLPHYGINTGFGSLSNKRIDHDDLENLQRNLIRSHAAGIGDPLDEEIVRGMMFVLACSLSRAKSGVRVEVVAQLISMLNANIRIKLSAFTLGASTAGFAGCFFAARQGFISPESFIFIESAIILAIVVLGGMGSQVGVICAAIVMTILPELAREFSEYRMLMFGLLMVLMMRWRPQGLVPMKRPHLELK